MFSTRLENFRAELNVSKLEMAKKLDISEGYYSLLVNNKREVSKKILYKLVVLSNKPEEYWVYGIETDEDVIMSRNVCKCSIKAFELLRDCNYLSEEDINLLFDYEQPREIRSKMADCESLLIKAMRADLKHMFEKDKLK